MSDFTEHLKEYKDIVTEAVAAQSAAMLRLCEHYELQINDLECDLAIAVEDLENEKRLTHTLKMKLDKIFAKEDS